MFEIQDSNTPGKRQYDIELTPVGLLRAFPADVAIQLRQMLRRGSAKDTARARRT